MCVLYGVNMNAWICVRVCVAAAGFYRRCNVVVTDMMRVFSSLCGNRYIFSKDDGTADMRAVSDPIREGAEGFLKIQYSAISRMAVLMALMIMGSYSLRPSGESGSGGVDQLGPVVLGFLSSSSFAMGAACSAFTGQCMYEMLYVFKISVACSIIFPLMIMFLCFDHEYRLHQHVGISVHQHSCRFCCSALLRRMFADLLSWWSFFSSALHHTMRFWCDIALLCVVGPFCEYGHAQARRY